MQNLARNVDVFTQGLKYSISGLMNLANETNEPESDVFFVNFNQDYTSLAVGSQAGYKLYSLNSVDYLHIIYENDTEDIRIIERLFSSSLVAMVTLSSPRKLRVCHFRKGTEICYYSYSNTILAVKLNRSQAKTMIPAHDSPLAALAFNPNGTKIATASEKGTVIRVFQVHDGTKLFEFRRGVKRCVSISSLAFSMDSTDSMFLCCSSNTETVHIFKLEEPKEALRQATEESQTWMGYLTKAVSASANYLPSQVTDVFNQGRAFASVHLPFQGLKSVCAITVVQKVFRLLVASADGYLYVYNLDTTEGGDCTLLKQHRLDGKRDDVDCASVSTAESGSGETPAATATEIVQNAAYINSYAGVLCGCSSNSISDSEKHHEMIAATESPPTFSCPFRLNDDAEFPPITQNMD
ncbi:WD repeat domain phosphoinositide-interacting protein 2 isoform X5 [Colletes gigas]|uniref:WD repeat domain phosphoinositide-interacting protein 2 isoform X5 n=1 Tax=Colletes gigas TaxID=935657 RepID=UPI001C9B8457|nr:WD repeat domain phosphoinositide-interacting protein 2 isoform X5 [Colletes gigas]